MRARSAACVALLALLPWLLFHDIALGRKVFADGDLFVYNYPLLAEIARQWRAGQVPLWHPGIFGGTPLLAQMQGGVLYPMNALFLVLPTWLAFGQTILLHYALAGVFMFVYLRNLALRRLAALVGALLFMLAGFSLGHLGHVSSLRNLPWLPLILFGFDRFRLYGDRRGLGLAALAVGLLLVSGHPQLPLYALIVAVAYGLWCAFRDRVWRQARAMLSILALGSLVGAAQWVTTLAAVPEYLRPAHGDYAYFVNFSLHPVMLANIVFPGLVPCDSSEQNLYVGALGLLLGVVGACVPLHRLATERAFFRGVALLAVLLAIGDATPLYRLLFHLPLFNVFTAPARHGFEFTFAASVLAALGFEALLEARERASRRALAAAAAVAGAGLAALGAVALTRALEPALPAEASYLLEMPFPWAAVRAEAPWVLGSALVVIGLGLARLRTLSAGLVPALLALDLFSAGGSIYARYDPAVYTQAPRSLSALRADTTPFRIAVLEQPESLEELRECLAPDFNAAVSVESVNGFDSLMLQAIDRGSGGVMPTYGLVAGREAWSAPAFERFLDLLNVRYVLVPRSRPATLEPARYTPFYENDTVRIFRNERALPRAFVVFDEESLAPRPGATPEAKVELEGLAAGRLDATVTTTAPGVFVHASTFASGWEGSVDGREVPVLRVVGLLQGVAVPVGRHRVRLRYRPWPAAAGAALSLIGLAAAVFVSRPGARR